MKIFTRRSWTSRILYFSLFLVIFGCATSKKYVAEEVEINEPITKEISHSFYLFGGYKADKEKATNPLLLQAQEEIEKTNTPSTIFFLGDYGNKAITSIEQQMGLAKASDQAYFLLGDEEWKSKKVDSIKKFEKYVESKDWKTVDFEPENNCPLERKHIDDNLDMIIVNSTWLISDWDRIRGIHQDCPDIVTLRQFLEKLQNYINDAQDKNVLIAMHHPVFSNGKYAGQHTFGSQLLPIPFLGAAITNYGSLAGFSPKSITNNRYNAYAILMSFLAQESERVTFVSGHENSLQYLVGQNGTHQIISGSVTEKDATHRTSESITTMGGSLEFEGKYTFGENGYARLDYFEDGSSKVTFKTAKETNTLSVHEPFPDKSANQDYSPIAQKEIKSAIVGDEKILKKSGLYKTIWGERYRRYFTEEVTAPVAILDTLYGGLEVVKKGGGHQSYNLRLEDKDGKEYAMRSLDKNAARILKFNLFGAAYNLDEYEDSATEKIIYDFFTTSHPYLTLPIGPLSEAAEINHATPKLFYIPKQKTLGQYNEVYGDALYFIEERPSEKWIDYEGYTVSVPDEAGSIKAFESTEDMLSKLEEDESYSVDERSVVRARLFDMLIGDWDRHADQYRWGEYEINDDDKRFVAIPRDRDNAFPKFDGIGVPFIQWFTPLIRSWQTYEPEIKNLKWLNDKGNLLDNVLVTKNGKELWIEEAMNMQANISDAAIEKAFGILPKEVQDEVSEEVKNNFKQRLKDLHKYAEQYGEYLEKRVILHGTNKDDIIQVERQADGKTKIVLRRNLTDDPNEKFYERVFDKERTKEIWIYGLNDTDKFIVSGEGDHEIFIRLIGGYGEDTYQIENNDRVKVYDFRYEDSDFSEMPVRKNLTNQFSTNSFHWRNYQENNNVVVPAIGYRTNDGFTLGLTDIYTVNGFNGNPFKQQHLFSANYYSIFQGVDARYQGTFANIIPKWNLELEGYLTNNRYSINYFGFGNETENLEDTLDLDFYRSVMQNYKVRAGLAIQTLRISAVYENFKINEFDDRIFNRTNLSPEVFESQNYIGAEAGIRYQNDDANDFPTRGFLLEFQGGYRQNTQLDNNRFGYARLKLAFSKKLIKSGDLVFGTEFEGMTNIGNDFFFYHAPSLGGQNGLRGFRDERFTGKSYFYQSTDLRLRLKRVRTSILPLTIGLFGGFDYGRVWVSNDTSNVWHHSQGGGIWVSGLSSFGLSAGYFNSVDGNIIQIGFGFGF
ncbi:hypothetical protein FGM00_04695 [Aggregatimonas sangjinii]|uniref:Haemolysin activator HlyB C-terminal domain-containing protein n=1 Tax=Aggregatimonas sangjinii TaxID=2583587 RepID=A0A5B7SR23_9FLAO|nr:hypothetical protein [Aggregatimonas sangjinii]QCW99440.1 hypothetical protein FGM00_04695 [Aggregatimonas sangjinii]